VRAVGWRSESHRDNSHRSIMAIFRKVTVTILLAAFSASVGYPLYLDLYYLYDMP